MIILEGGDFAGKTSVHTKLTTLGITSKDRDKALCGCIQMGVPIPTICEQIKPLLNTRTSYIILYCTDKKTLAQRLQQRIDNGGTIDEYDKHAFEYNCIYQDVYTQLAKFYPNILLLDTARMSIDEVIMKIKAFTPCLKD